MDQEGLLERQRRDLERALVDAGGTWGWELAAGFLGCTVGTLKVWASQRRVPFVRVNGLVRFRKSDLTKWMDKNLVTAGKQ